MAATRAITAYPDHGTASTWAPLTLIRALLPLPSPHYSTASAQNPRKRDSSQIDDLGQGRECDTEVHSDVNGERWTVCRPHALYSN